MQGPLSEITVLDLSRVLAGPYATMWLADMGAEVIKVERPGTGDETRSYGPPFVNGESAYFMSINRNKRSLTLDFKTEKGKEILYRLAEQSDVLVENFRPGTLERAGFGYEAMKERNPSLIYTSISGFGQTGPYQSEPGFDLSIQGMSGLMSLTGDPGGPPMKYGTSISDLISGIYAAFGTVMALYHRQQTGEGQHVDVGMLDGMVSLLTYQAGRFFATGEVPRRMGNFHPNISPYETFETADGYMNLALGNDQLYRRFCDLIERPDLKQDDRFETNPKRVEHRHEIHALIEEETRRQSTEAWLRELSEAGIPAGPIHTVDETLQHPQVQARDMVREVDHPEAGTVSVTGVPIKMDRSPGSVRTPPPQLGEHNEEILKQKLGYTSQVIRDLSEKDVI